MPEEGETVKQLAKCRACGAPVGPGAKICPHCGVLDPDVEQNVGVTIGVVAGCLSMVVFSMILGAVSAIVGDLGGGTWCLFFILIIVGSVWVGYTVQKTLRKHED